MTKPLHVAHFKLVRNTNDAFLVYRLEGSGHVILLPRSWFPYPDPPQDITIEIHDRQLSLLETALA